MGVIKKLLTISTSFESFNRIKTIIQKDEMIYGTIGIHPHETNENKITSDIIIKNINENDKIIGIGETGLDFYYNNSDKDDQIISFKEHIEASIKTNSPLIIHSRDAEEETFNILNDYKNKNLKILMHCFTGSLNFAKKIIRTKPLSEIVKEEILPGEKITSKESLIEHCKKTVKTGWHPVGTCKMGQDDMAVVDEKLRVKGVSNLRVIDASIMPNITSGNTNAPTIMIAEKGADMILSN